MSRWRDMADRLSGKAPASAKRSGQWPATRNRFLQDKTCAVCGGKRMLIAHHEIPFHLAPDLELVEDNLIPLCEAGRYGMNCHLLLGHGGQWRRINVNVRADVAYWNEKLR